MMTLRDMLGFNIGAANSGLREVHSRLSLALNNHRNMWDDAVDISTERMELNHIRGKLHTFLYTLYREKRRLQRIDDAAMNAQKFVDKNLHTITSDEARDAFEKGADANDLFAVASQTDNIPLMKVCLEYGARTCEYSDYHDGIRRIHEFTSEPEMLLLLMNYACCVNCVTRDGETSLIIAAMNDEHECIDILLRGGANPFFADNDRETALDHADERGKELITLGRSRWIKER